LFTPFLEHFYFIERYSELNTKTYHDFKIRVYFNKFTVHETIVNIRPIKYIKIDNFLINDEERAPFVRSVVFTLVFIFFTLNCYLKLCLKFS